MRVHATLFLPLLSWLADESAAFSNWGFASQAPPLKNVPFRPTVLLTSLDSASRTGGTVPGDGDDAIMKAYEDWRTQHKKGAFDAARYENFKTNYLALAGANATAMKQARDQGRAAPEPMKLNEYGDYSIDEYKKVREAQQGTSGRAVPETLESTEALQAAFEDFKDFSKTASGESVADQVKNTYKEWCKFYNKKYEEARLDTFATNLKKVQDYNKETGKDVKLNKYADLTAEEYAKIQANEPSAGSANQGKHGEKPVGIPSSDAKTTETDRTRTIYRDWCEHYGKPFDEERMKIFERNFLQLEAAFQKTGKEMLLNEFADLTAAEFQAMKAAEKQGSKVEGTGSYLGSLGKVETDSAKKEPDSVISSPTSYLESLGGKKTDEKNAEKNVVPNKKQDTEQKARAKAFLEEAQRKAAEEKKKIAEAARIKAEKEEAQRKAEAEKKRLAEEAKIKAEKAEAEKQRLAEEAKIKAEKEEAQRKAEAEKKRIAEEAKIKAEKAEAEKKRIAEEARIKAEAEKKRIAEEARIKAEAEKKRLAEEAKIKAEKEEAQRKAEVEKKRIAEEARIKAEAEKQRLAEEARIKAEAEKKRIAEEARIKAEKEETQRKAEVEKKRIAEEARIKAETEKKRIAEEARIKAEAEKKRIAEEARIKAEKEEAQRKAEAERKRIAEEARIKAEAEKKRIAEEARIKAEKEDAQRKAEAERKRIAEEAKIKAEKEEAQRKADAERKRLAEAARIRAEAEKERLAEEARIKAQKEEEEKRRLAEERRLAQEARTKAEQEAWQKAAEKRRLAAEARAKAEAEAKKAEEARRLADEARAKSEEAARQKAEAEARKVAQEESARKKAAEIARMKSEEANRQSEETRLKAVVQERQRLEGQARQRAETAKDKVGIEAAMKSKAGGDSKAPTTPQTGQRGPDMGAVAKTWVARSAYLDELNESLGEGDDKKSKDEHAALRARTEAEEWRQVGKGFAEEAERAKRESVEKKAREAQGTAKDENVLSMLAGFFGGQKSVESASSPEKKRPSLQLSTPNLEIPKDWVNTVFDFFGSQDKAEGKRAGRGTITLEREKTKTVFDMFISPDQVGPKEPGKGFIKVNKDEKPSVFSFFANFATTQKTAPQKTISKPLSVDQKKEIYEKKRVVREAKVAKLNEERVRLLEEKMAREAARAEERRIKEAQRQEEEKKAAEQRRIDRQARRQIQAEDRETEKARREARKMSAWFTGSKTKSDRKKSYELGSVAPVPPMPEPEITTIPALSMWTQNEDGSITGYVSNSEEFATGAMITTSPVRDRAEPGLTVMTVSGSQYRLGSLAKRGTKIADTGLQPTSGRPSLTTPKRKPQKSTMKVPSFFFGLGEPQSEELQSGVAVLYKWTQNPDGSLTGIVKNKDGFPDGAKITTSPAKLGAKSGTVVTTAGGSKYQLR